MGKIRRDGPRRYVDVDRHLRDLLRAQDRFESSYRTLRNTHGFRSLAALERHVDRLGEDPEYVATCDRLRAATGAWTGTLSEFVNAYAEDLDEVGLAVPDRIDERHAPAAWQFGRRLARAPRLVQRQRDASRALLALTGAPTIAEAVQIARAAQPRAGWSDLDRALEGVEAAGIDVDRAWAPGQTPTVGGLCARLDRAREHLASSFLESQAEVADPKAAEARYLLRRASPAWSGRERPRPGERIPEAEVRAALVALGFVPGETREDVAAQARYAAQWHPDLMRERLSTAKRAAEELQRLTGKATPEEAYRAARETLRANEPYVDRPRSGPVVYSGGLPGLGKGR